MAPIAATLIQPKTRLQAKNTYAPFQLQGPKMLREQDVISTRLIDGKVIIEDPAIDKQQSFELVQTLLLVSVS